MIVFENYKKEKPVNKYGKFFLAEEAPGDEEEYIPPRPRNAKIITVKPNRRKTIDFAAGAEDLANDPDIDSVDFDLGDNVDPNTDELPNVDNIFNNPIINDQLNISNDEPVQNVGDEAPEEFPTDNITNEPSIEEPAEQVDQNPVEEPLVNNNPAEEPTSEIPPTENQPADELNTGVENQPIEEPTEEPTQNITPENPDASTDVNADNASQNPSVNNNTIDVAPPEQDPLTTPENPDVNQNPTEVTPEENPTNNPVEVTPPEGDVHNTPSTSTGDEENPNAGQVITPDGGSIDNMGSDDFSAGGDIGDMPDTNTDTSSNTDQQQNTSGVGVGLDTMRKYQLFNEFIHFGNAVTNYISKLENIILDNPGQNQLIKYVIDNLHNIKDMIYDYITMKFELVSYVSARTFFDEMYVSTQLSIGMLAKLNEYKTE